MAIFRIDVHLSHQRDAENGKNNSRAKCGDQKRAKEERNSASFLPDLAKFSLFSLFF